MLGYFYAFGFGFCAGIIVTILVWRKVAFAYGNPWKPYGKYKEKAADSTL